jgi:hypothetical protein
MEAKYLATLALYAVGLALSTAVFALNIVNSLPSTAETVSINTLVILLGIAVFSLAVAGIRSVARSSKYQ